MTITLLFFFLLQTTYLVSSLNQDGLLLLSFKRSILSDPLSSLDSWTYTDDTPCTWNGVTCTGFTDPTTTTTTTSRVISLLLPNSHLLGSIPSDLGLLQHLRHLDLSGNLLNGTLPPSLFGPPSDLKILSLANNEISGQIPDLFRNLTRLQLLDLSDNALTGGVPASLSLAPNVSVAILSNNYLSGGLSALAFGHALQVLDLSSNLLNGTLPPGLVRTGARVLNLSSNRLSGEIPGALGPVGLLDLSGNEFTGEVPVSFASQKPAAFAGNPDLCGKPLKNVCSILSSLSGPPNPESPPALAAIPNTTTRGVGSSAGNDGGSGGLTPATIVAIVVGDLGGIALLLAIFFYVYRVKKRKKSSRGQADTSESTGTSSSEEEEGRGVELQEQNRQGAILVTVDGDTELEMESLLKASAYILGATSSTIVYKAVLADGTALAVRRIGESRAIEKVKDLEALVRSIAKLRHPNLVRIWGFYWGPEEKLLIHDYAANGSLANVSFTRKSASSPLNLGLEARLKIARGIARGLAYIHEKKSVHGNIKPSNILLDSDMEAKIGDFGLLTSGKPTSARLFGSKRSIQSQGSLPESFPVPGTSPVGSSLSYQAPESLQNLKPNAKWDVYSFGVILLELISGRVFAEEELSEWNMGFVTEERNRILRMADPALRGEVQGREEVLLSCFRLGFACASVAPQKRPTMKDAAMTLDRIPPSSTSTSSSVL